MSRVDLIHELFDPWPVALKNFSSEETSYLNTPAILKVSSGCSSRKLFCTFMVYAKFIPIYGIIGPPAVVPYFGTWSHMSLNNRLESFFGSVRDKKQFHIRFAAIPSPINRNHTEKPWLPVPDPNFIRVVILITAKMCHQSFIYLDVPV